MSPISLFASPMAIPVVAILCVFGWLIVQSIVAGVRGIVKHRNEVELKQMLIDRGMSADEIERVVRASSLDNEPEE